MTEPMTIAEIDTELIDVANRCYREIPLSNAAKRATVLAIREAFTVGSDQGRIRVMTALQELMAPRIAEMQSESLARSMSTIARWCRGTTPGEPLRSYSAGPTLKLGPSEQWRVSCYGGMTQHHFFGADQSDALAQMAQWCEGDMAPEVTT